MLVNMRSGIGRRHVRVPVAVAQARPAAGSVRAGVQALIVFAAWGAAALGLAPSASAASYTWTGAGGTGLWSTAANWTPVFTDIQPLDLVFTDANGSSSTNDLAAGTTLQGMTFTTTAGESVLTNTDAANPAANSLTVVAGAIIANQSANRQTVGVQLNVVNSLGLNATGAGRLAIDSLSGSGAVSKAGNGVVEFTGAYGFAGYTGNVTLFAGSTEIRPDGNFPNATVTVGPNAALIANAFVKTLVSSGTLLPGNFDDGAGLRYGLQTSSLEMQPGNDTLFAISGTRTFPIGVDHNFIELVAPSGAASLVYGGNVGINFENSTEYSIGTVFNLIKDGGTTAADRTGVLAGIDTTGVGPYAGLNFTMVSPGTGSGDAIWLSNFAGSTGTRLEFREGTGQLVVVPEPSTMVFAGFGAAMSAWTMLRGGRARRQRAATRA